LQARSGWQIHATETGGINCTDMVMVADFEAARAAAPYRRSR